MPIFSTGNQFPPITRNILQPCIALGIKVFRYFDSQYDYPVLMTEKVW